MLSVHNFTKILFASIVSVFVISPAASKDNESGAFGGGGGNLYRMVCPSGEKISGIAVRHGKTIDALGIACDKYDRVIQDYTGHDGRAGGHRGKGYNRAVENGLFLRKARTTWCKYKGKMVIRSFTFEFQGKSDSRKRVGKTLGTRCDSGAGGGEKNFAAPAGHQIIGFYGYAGERINSLGVLYRPIDTAPRRTNPQTTSRPGREWVIPANDTYHADVKLSFPQSMPEVRYPSGFKGCSAEEKFDIKQAWALAHYNTWIANTAMDWMQEHAGYRERAWSYPGIRPESNSSSQVGYWSYLYSPASWFGSYDTRRFVIVRSAIKKLWEDRFRRKTFKVMCRVRSTGLGAHPCYTGEPLLGIRISANHFVYGRINFCTIALDKDLDDLASTVVHELLHWLMASDGKFITDRHTHCHGGGRCKVLEAMYGWRNAAHLAHYDGGSRGTHRDKNRRIRKHRLAAAHNNDNYVMFIGAIGRAAYYKRIAAFPEQEVFR